MQSPNSRLIEFMSEMHNWELECAARERQCDAGRMNYDEAKRIGMDEYTRIFQRFCSQSKATPRDYFFTEPPDYDGDSEAIISCIEQGPDIIKILTKQNHNHCKSHIFRLALEDGEWRLIDKKILVDDGQLLETSL